MKTETPVTRDVDGEGVLVFLEAREASYEASNDKIATT